MYHNLSCDMSCDLLYYTYLWPIRGPSIKCYTLEVRVQILNAAAIKMKYFSTATSHREVVSVQRSKSTANKLLGPNQVVFIERWSLYRGQNQ